MEGFWCQRKGRGSWIVGTAGAPTLCSPALGWPSLAVQGAALTLAELATLPK